MKKFLTFFLMALAVFALTANGVLAQASARSCDPAKSAKKSDCYEFSQICQPVDPKDLLKGGQCVTSNEVTQNRDPGGLVPCTTNCNFCSLLELVERVLNRIFLQIVPSIAILLIVIAGLMMVTSLGKDDRRQKANAMLFNVIIGLAIMYTAWIIVHTVLMFLIDSKSSVKDIIIPWHKIECNLSASSSSPNSP